MSEADEVYTVYLRIAEVIRDAVANGAGGMTDANEALLLLRQAIEKLEGSRVYGQQELRAIKEIIDRTNALVSGSSSLEAMTAIANFEQARLKLEEYVTKIYFPIERLKQVTEVLDLRINEFDESGPLLRTGIENLRTHVDRA